LKQNHLLYLVAALIVIGVAVSLIYGWDWLAAGKFASGLIAAGDFTIGVLSAGNFAVGIFAIGIFSVGIFSLGIFAYALKKKSLKD